MIIVYTVGSIHQPQKDCVRWCRQTFQLQKGLAINDAHVQKFVEIVSRRREEMIEEGVAEEFVDFDEPIRQNTDNPIGRQQVDTILDEDFLLR